jgi:glycosyltransferase involved in cell wall biosynthesis
MNTLVSVCTPTHNSQWLLELYESLKAQTYADWQWVIVPNNGAVGMLRDVLLSDPRIKVATAPDERESRVGALKRFVARSAEGQILVEVDHDDLLTPDCLEKLVSAFAADKEVGMVYSNTVNIDVRTKTAITWSARYGWTYRPFKLGDVDYLEARSAPPLPQNISRIWFAPNHVRAYRATAYWAVGGHDSTMKIGDDHDLTCRMYTQSKIKQIDEPLYIYRVHGENTWLKNMDEIQGTMWATHDRHILPMGLRWAHDNGLLAIDLCGGIDKPAGLISVDIQGGDVTADLNARWPFEDGTVGVIRAYDAVEHLRDPVHTMNEAHRVLAHGGLFLINVPSTDGRGAWCDPTHVSFWNSRSFRYYTEANIRRYLEPRCTARFQAMKVVDVRRWEEQLPYVEAHLIALKAEIPRFYGEKLI